MYNEHPKIFDFFIKSILITCGVGAVRLSTSEMTASAAQSRGTLGWENLILVAEWVVRWLFM